MNKVIACQIFKPYLEMLALPSDNNDICYLEISQHNYPNRLAKAIQKEIDESIGYQHIIVLYGLCGGTLPKIQARTIPLVLVKVHDCMSILLGSKQKYHELTKDNKSLVWSCYSLEKQHQVNDTLQQWYNDYDEETVEYLMSMLQPSAKVYISFNIKGEQEYIQDKEVILGELTFLQEILSLQSKELLFLKQGEKIKISIDDTNVMEKEREHGNFK